MKLAVEIPIPELAKLNRHTDFDFVLTHMVLSNTEYCDYYRKSRRFQILDNSFFELGKAVSGQKIMAAADLIHPNEVVAPDGVQLTRRFIRRYGQQLQKKKIQIAAVAHGKTLKSFINNIVLLANIPEVTTICIPLDLDFLPKDHPAESLMMRYTLSRLLVLEVIEEICLHTEKNYHLLGCSLPIEFKIVGQRFKWVRSFDTSAPVVSVLQEIPLSKVTDKLSREDDYFKVQFNGKTRTKVVKNIQLLKRWGNGK